MLKLKINIKIDFYAINCEENFKWIIHTIYASIMKVTANAIMKDIEFNSKNWYALQCLPFY